MTLLLEAMYGSETFDTGNAKVGIFAVPCRLYNSFDREMHIEVAAKKSDIPVRIQSKGNILNPYNEVYRNDLGGWTQSVFHVEEGMIFKIFAHRAGIHGQRVTNVSQFIRIRAGAAYRELKVKLTGSPKARFEYATIKGCFDILTLEDAEKRGVKVPSNFKTFFRPVEVARVMEFKTLRDETETPLLVREKIVRRGGEEIVVQKTRKARAINLDDE